MRKGSSFRYGVILIVLTQKVGREGSSQKFGDFCAYVLCGRPLLELKSGQFLKERPKHHLYRTEKDISKRVRYFVEILRIL